MLENLKEDRRFKCDLYKTTKPYNALTILDPRYSDLYFTEEQKTEAINVIYNDVVFRDERDQDIDQEVEDNVNVIVPEEPSKEINPIERRRLELLAKKGSSQVPVRRLNLKEKIQEEVKFICAASIHISADTDPMKWMKENKNSVPNIVKFWLAHSSFPATSCSAERVFNVDSLIITDLR